MLIARIGIGSGPTRPSGDLFAPEGQRAGNRGRKETRTGDRGGRRREQREGEGIFVLVWDKGLPLDREETDVAHRQMAVYKGKRETSC